MSVQESPALGIMENLVANGLDPAPLTRRSLLEEWADMAGYNNPLEKALFVALILERWEEEDPLRAGDKGGDLDDAGKDPGP